jgi:hypothetical protein
MGGQSRKKVLESGAQRIGNAAAHLAIWDDPFSIREAEEYTRQAKIVIEDRSWNDQEIARFREIAIRRAKKEIIERSKEERFLNVDFASKEAIEKIDEFVEKELRK